MENSYFENWNDGVTPWNDSPNLRHAFISCKR